MTATTPAHPAGSSEVNVTTPGGSDPVFFTYDPLNADSQKLRKLQIAFTPVVAQTSGAAISGAVQDAIGAGFSDSPQQCTPNGNGFTCHFAGDREEHVAVLERPVRSFDSETDPRMSRVDDAFSALAGAGSVVKTPPRPVVAPQRDWMGWVDFRGTSFSSSGAGDTTSGLQVNATAGLTRKLNPNFLVGILGWLRALQLYRTGDLRPINRRWLDRRHLSRMADDANAALRRTAGRLGYRLRRRRRHGVR